MHKDFKNNLSTIILCGGSGKRLYPLTKKTPKPLIKIKNKEILSYIIDHLNYYDLKNILISTGFKHNAFKKFFSKKRGYNKKINLIFTGKNTDIIKRITKCKKYLNEYIMVCYGDTLVDINLDKLIDFFLKNKEKIVLSAYNYKSQYGLLKIQSNGKVLTFKEKPDLGLFFNIGFFLMKKKHLKSLEKFKTFQGFLENKDIINKLRTYVHKGKHITINTLNELVDAKKNIEYLKN